MKSTTEPGPAASPVAPGAPESFVNPELSWLQFARRVLELASDPEVPLLERVKFTGIVGMLHDEFFMKRISGLKRLQRAGSGKESRDGLTALEQLRLCRTEVDAQMGWLSRLIEGELRPALAEAGIPISDHDQLSEHHRTELRALFTESVLPVLTPLAVDAEHPFPFISNLGLNLAVVVKERKRERFVRVKMPSNRPRWVPLSGGAGFVPLEQVIAANLDLLFPRAEIASSSFRVTRGVEGSRTSDADEGSQPLKPGSIISQVTEELIARKFAGEVRLQVSEGMPQELSDWLRNQLGMDEIDTYSGPALLRVVDLLDLRVDGRPELRDPEHHPVVHPRLHGVARSTSDDFFDEIRRGDILLHHPYHSFDASVLRFLEAAAVDPRVLAIKLTIYRTSSDSPIVRALAEAAQRGKQVAVLVEITARFDEAPNIAWGRLLEKEGVHVAYGVEKLKTHVKLALVVREEADGLRSYVHVGTGNYHPTTARLYEDLGVLSCDPDLAADVAAVFNELTSATPSAEYRRLLVAPRDMRDRFVDLIRAEAAAARDGRSAWIRAKMNQLQDPELITELYRASQAGVPISLNVRGLCCLRPGVPGLSETIRVHSVLGRFLEHGRIYAFANDGDPLYFIGSADWMRRNLNHRVETITPVTAKPLRRELDEIFTVYENDNATAWDMQPDGSYVRRRPEPDAAPRPAQVAFMERVGGG